MNIHKTAIAKVCAVAFVAVPFSLTPAFAGPLMNHLGYAPAAEKQVVIPGNDANGLEVRDLKGKTVLKLKAPNVGEWEYSGEETQVFDISAVKAPGTYRLYRNGEYLGNPFFVGKNVCGQERLRGRDKGCAQVVLLPAGQHAFGKPLRRQVGPRHGSS